METGGTPIETIQQAKTYFCEMGCSHFHMCREFPNRYDEYKALGIPKDTEHKWVREQMMEYASAMALPTDDPGMLWIYHSRMADLVRILQTKDAIHAIRDATEAIVAKLPDPSKVIVAETINGRGRIQSRTGLIFLADKLGQKKMAKRFAEISLALCDSAKACNCEPERCAQAISTCNEITKLLG